MTNRLSPRRLQVVLAPCFWIIPQNVIEFEFAAIEIDAPHLVRYTYKLEGLEEEWVKPGERRFVRYPGLRPGEYAFKVRAGSMRDEWPDQDISLAISIAPPWWLSRWAYASYVCLFIGLLVTAYRLRVREIHLKQRAEMEHLQAERLAAVDRLKSRFFANISHEFRTPLTLILGPVRQMIASDTSPEKRRQLLDIVHGNGQKLLLLINQLLDLSKLEAGSMKLAAEKCDLVRLLRGLVMLYQSFADTRGIRLEFKANEEKVEGYFDREKVEKIFNNLLSNAFKFTPDGGTITVSLNASRAHPAIGENSGNEEGQVEVGVSDTGIGISSGNLAHVFDRFYQVDDSTTRAQQGTGIGLALAKELVELHHGSIRVTSEPGRGTAFVVRLPLGMQHLRPDEIGTAVEGHEQEMLAGQTDQWSVPLDEPAATEGQSPGHRPIILVIDDNADVRLYVRDTLPVSYEVIEAGDGAEGISRAQEAIPDLIISDVMMPKQDGYEVCRVLKSDERTSHIPVILLTAKAASENKIEGLERGADDFLVKPFEPGELVARVNNLVESRRSLRERFSKGIVLKPGEIAITSIDDAFLQKAMSLVEEHMGDERFGAEQLADEIGLSRMQLHRKLTALTNQSAGDFIRTLRLHRAMSLLQENAGTVSEVAYNVGFSDSSYFAKRFRDQFGCTPGEARENGPARVGRM